MWRRSWALLLLWIGIAAVFGCSEYYRQDDQIASRIVQNLEKAIEVQERVLEQLVTDFSELSEPLAIQTNYPYPIRVYDNGQLVYWNDNHYLPDYLTFRMSEELAFKTLGKSQYIISRESVQYHSSGLLEFYAFIPIYRHFERQNTYLNSEYTDEIFLNQGSVVEEGYPFEYGDQTFFHIGVDRNASTPLILLFEILCIGAFLITLGTILARIHTDYNRVFVVGLIVVLRFMQLRFMPLTQFFVSDLFDPTLYTSKWWLPTFGDLILNQGILLLVVFHLYRVRLASFSSYTQIVRRGSFVLHFLLSLAVLTTAELQVDLTWNMLQNSQVTLDVSRDIAFGWIRFVELAMIVSMGIVYFIINHATFIQVRKTVHRWPIFMLAYVLACVVFYFLFPRFGLWVIMIQSAVWFVMAFNSALLDLQTIRYSTLFYMVIVALSCSILHAITIYKQYEYEERQDKRRFASDLLIGNDILGEYYMSDLVREIQNDPFIRTRFLSDIFASQNIRNQISRHIPAYLGRYHTQVYMYTSDDQPFGQREAPGFAEWMANEGLEPTSYPAIYFDPSEESGRHKYIVFVELTQFNRPLGKLVLEFTQKQYVSRTIFPSILLESSPQATISDYSYAFYDTTQLLFSSGAFSFPSYMPQKMVSELRLRTRGIEEKGDHYLGIELEDGRLLVIVSPVYPNQHILANVSFLFIAFTLVLGLIFLVMIQYRPIESYSLANKIQLYAAMVIIVPAVLIGIAILNTLNSSYRDEINRNYQKRASNIAEQITNDTRAFMENLINRDEYTYRLISAGNLAESDILVYDRRGRLLATNRGEVMRLKLISDQISPRPFYALKIRGKLSQVRNERIGDLQFRPPYAGIYSYEEGEFLGIVCVPFFNFKNHLNRQQIEVFNNLITLFTLIFFLALIAGNIGLRNMVAPLRLVADRLGNTSYLETEGAEQINYKGKDEIGLLIGKYNTMLSKLEESKAALLAVQKETAWKEIARQVAHEIKNPLTPMRLKIQQMQRGYDRDSLPHRTLESLLVQVDSLASIADSFSAFAQMPAPNNEVINFSDLVNSIARLYRTDGLEVTIQIEPDIHANIDSRLFSQILNNLLLNAIQSMEGPVKQIEIVLKRLDDRIHFTIRDEGSGIPVDVRDKIFKPYFSTKEKGSGIGLALAKKGIEQAGGTIWFETEASKGTSFFFTLPVHSGS